MENYAKCRFIFISSVNSMLPLFHFVCVFFFLSWFVCCCFYFISFSPNCRLVMNLTTKTVHSFAYFFLFLSLSISFRLLCCCCCSFARTYNRFRVARTANTQTITEKNMIRFAFFFLFVSSEKNNIIQMNFSESGRWQS